MKSKIVIGLMSLILAGFGSADSSHSQWIEGPGFRVRADHPRIWLTPERILRMTNDATNRTEKFVRLKDTASAQKESSVLFQNVLNYLAMHIAVSETLYADRAIAKTDAIIGTQYADREKAAPYMMCVALACDWLCDYPALSQKIEPSDEKDRKGRYIDWLETEYQRAYVLEGYVVNGSQSWHNYHLLGMLGL